MSASVASAPSFGGADRIRLAHDRDAVNGAQHCDEALSHLRRIPDDENIHLDRNSQSVEGGRCSQPAWLPVWVFNPMRRNRLSSPYVAKTAERGQANVTTLVVGKYAYPSWPLGRGLRQMAA